ncbi:MAG: potassium transporter Kup [Candidatus Lindowbacteria bacterium RIFCSPLOWO2_12_FULL_62_27]|nr:MAG: potassium transporter Kup [Candidatus Lindowbacteria bacterium RIFCSPLOWO2_12_FULL_62_27]
MESSESASDSRLKHTAVVLAVLGVIFGDIGTSPLYAVKECVYGAHSVPPTPQNLFGILSLMFWSLTMVVAVKYLTFIMRADNRGEGGILALLALIPPDAGGAGRYGKWVTSLVIFGAALLYGDGIITPALSVLSAVEGLEIAAPNLKPLVIPLTICILLGLFWFQRRGTAGVGRVFGPVMVIWFSTLAILGVIHISRQPSILLAVNPMYAIRFFIEHQFQALRVLGSVFLVVTGGEALYADMGHFGLRPIRIAWYGFVMPALLLNYFGQGAYLLGHPNAASNVFYSLVPAGWGMYLLIVLATAATIIASQAMISGAYSLTRQAVQLGFFPRVTVVHTSGETEGQIYIPEINWALAAGTVGLVIFFKESTRLAAAYGIAVTGTMLITSLVYGAVLVKARGWPVWKAAALVVLFLSFDVPFLASTALKFVHGGYVPILLALALFTIMMTWKNGRELLAARLSGATPPLETFLADAAREQPLRVGGTAIFMASNPTAAPNALVHHFKHNQTLHETVILLSVHSEPVPKIPRTERIRVSDLGFGFFRIEARYGFMQTPHVPSVVRDAALHFHVPVDSSKTTYYLGRETLMPSSKNGMAYWRKVLFVLITRNARSATKYFGIPAVRVFEIGMQIKL